MGTYGLGVLDDDTAWEVHNEYLNRYNEGEEHTAIREALLTQYATHAFHKWDEAYTTFWLAFAQAQWECGALHPDTLKRVTDIVERDIDHENWRHADNRKQARRRRVLKDFLKRIQQPRERPRKRRRFHPKPSVYQPGDCLAIRLPGGDYGAALVLAAEYDGRTDGMNLIGVLDYKSPHPPTREVFERQELILERDEWGDKPYVVWYGAYNHKRQAKGIELVGNVPVRDDMPRGSNAVGTWHIGIQIEFHYKRESRAHD